MSTTFTCPHCGKLATTEIPCYPVDLGQGTPVAYFPLVDLELRRELHVDTRICCEPCWQRAGREPVALGRPHPYSGTAHERRLSNPVGERIGAPAKEE